MKRLLQTKIFMVLTVLMCFGASVHGQQYDKQVLRVKFEKSSENRLSNMTARLNNDGVIQTGLSNVDVMNQKHHVVKMTRVFPHAGKFEAKHQKYGLHLWYEIEIDGNTNIETALADFAALGEISTGEFIHAKNNRVSEVSAFKSKLRATLPEGVDDPNYGNQWHYENTGQTGGVIDADIDLDNAWLVETGSDEVIVSIHDEGVDFDHEDLAGNMWTNTAEIPNNGIDDDNNGFIDDVYGYNFAQLQGTITPGNHGTHVAGTVAAESNNGIGGSGVAGGTGADDGVRLMSCQVFSNSGSRGFSVSYVYAADNGAVISQNSWGYTVPGSYEQSVLDAIRYFIAEAGYDENGNQVGPMAGGIVIFAAGNDADNDEYYPGYIEDVIAVAGTNHRDDKYNASNHGSWIDIAAPGENIFSSLINDEYSGVYSGTSMACPHVSGVAALIVSKFKDEGLTPDVVKSRLLNTTDPLTFDGSEDWGAGRVNAYKALADNDGAGPAAIADFSLESISELSATATWTAPGDMPNGTQVTTYDLRYSTSPINAGNFSEATSVVVKKPSSPGSSELALIKGLLPATTYYFAITSADYFGNASTISNVISGTTEEAPTVAVSGDPSVSIDLSTGTTTATGTFTIQNAGGNPLEYDILPIYGGIVAPEVTTTLLYPGNTASATIPQLQQANGQSFQNESIGGDAPGAQLNFENQNKNELAYDDGDENVSGALQVTNVGGQYISWLAATSFEVPAMDDRFVLSNVESYMQVSFQAASLSTTMMIIEGGDTPLQGTTRLSQEINNKEGSKYWDIPLEIPLAFESGDKFWVVFIFPEEPVKMGYDDVEGGNKANTHMAWMNNEWTDIQTLPGYENYVWGMRAIERTVDGLALDINHGVLESSMSQNIQVTYDAADIVRNAQYDFDIYVVSNDPVTPVKIVDAKANITGLLEPEMVVNPESITSAIDASVNTIGTETITITNTGDGDLIFDFENKVEVPEVSIASVTSYSSTLDVPVSAGIAPRVSTEMDNSIPVATYNTGAIAYAHQIHPDEYFVTLSTDAPGAYLSQGGSLEYNVVAGDFVRGDNSNMYIINDNAETLMKLDLETGERTVIGPTLPFNDITTDKYENVVYGTNFNGFTSELFILDVQTGEVEKIGSMGDGIMVAIACDGNGQMWGFKLNDGNIYNIDKLTGEATPVGHTGFTANYNQSMTWDPKSGIIYMAAYNYIEERGELRIVDTNTGATEVVGAFPDNAQVSALAFPGGGYHDFTSVSPSSGTVAPSASVDVTVTLDATELPNGEYYTPLSISTNDYDNLTKVIPVALEVTGQIGELSVDTQLMDFGSVLLGADKTIQLAIENDGIGALDISSITSTSGLFTTDFEEPQTIDMGGKLTVDVNFKPESVGQFNSVLTINSNDPANPETAVTLTGSAILPPEIVIQPDTVELTLNSGEVETRSFVIKNEGAYPLQYAMTEYEANIQETVQEENGVALNGLDGPDASGYRWIDSNDPNGPAFAWNDIAATGTEILSDTPFGSEMVTLPFTFPFYGEDKTSMYISVEGFVTFNSTSASTNFNRPIPYSFTPNDFIAAFWDNLRFPSTMGNIYYEEFADKVVIQWNEVGNSFSDTGTISFQMVLYNDGRIMLYYEQVSIDITNSATIGIENADATQGVEVVYNESYVEDELAILIFPGYQGFNGVTINKTNGIIAPGEEQTIEVTLDAAGLLEGSYSNELYIYNNDPVSPKAQFTSVLHVIGHPEISTNKTAIDFDPIIENTSVSQSFIIENKGSKEMIVSDITSSEDAFTTSFAGTATLAPGDKLPVEVAFAPAAVGDFSGNITITSDDDFGNSTLVIPVNGSAVASPEMSITTEIDPVDVTLNSGEQDMVNVTVGNLSGSTLNYVVHAPSYTTIEGFLKPEVVQGSDAFGYTWADSDSSETVNYDWIEISETGNRLPLGEGDGIFVSMPFTFPFYGNTYDEVQVASNGFLTFNANLGSSGGFNNRSMPSTIEPDNQIAVLWDDLDPEEMGDIYYLATPDQLVVQYTNVQRDNSDYTGTFQAILYANGDIKFQYKDLDNYTQNNSVTVGIENEDGSDGMTVVHNTLDYLKSEFAVMISSPFYRGSVEAGSSENFNLIFDAADIYDGIYAEPLRIVSNDASGQITDIPTTLTVTGVQEISLSSHEIKYDTLHYVEGETNYQIKEFNIYNDGTKALNVGPLSWSEATTDFQFDRDLLSYEIAPKDSLLVKVMFAPESANVFTNTLNIVSDDAASPMVSVNLEAVSLLPPQVAISTLDTLRLNLLTSETVTDITTLSNEGASNLSYTTDVQYYPYGLPGTVSDHVEFGDTIRYDTDETPSHYFGQGSSTQVAVQFMLETDQFYLTHVSNFYDNGGAFEPSLIQIFRGGTRPSEVSGAELITSQQFVHANGEGAGGIDAIIELEEPQLFYRDEDEYFWVVITYPQSMEDPAGYNAYDVTPPYAERHSWIIGRGWAKFGGGEFKIKALEQLGGYGDWLTISPEFGNIEVGTSTDIAFGIDASKANYGGNHFAIATYNFNDPAMESAQRVVDLYVNHKPEVDVLANVYVQEGEEVTFEANATDFDGSISSIALAQDYPFTTIEVFGNTATITSAPDFEQAGQHVIELLVTDDQGETSATSINVIVGNVNRAPIAGSMDDVQHFMHESSFGIEGAEVFSDEDQDELTYRGAVEDETMASITANTSGFEITPVAVGETVVTLFASDGFEEVSTTFNITILENHAPVVVKTIDDVARYVHEGAFNIDVSEVFSDADMDELTYRGTVENETMASITGNTSSFEITPVAAGETLVTLFAFDGFEEVSTTFTVTILENHAPVVVETMDDVVRYVHEGAFSIDISEVFSDADMDKLTYGVGFSDESLASAVVSSSIIEITPLAGGETVVTVMASDGYAEVSTSFNLVLRANMAPVAVTPDDVTLQFNGDKFILPIADVFSDEEGDELYFTAQSDNTEIAIATLSANEFVIEPLEAGTTTITLSATDVLNEKVIVTFNVHVELILATEDELSVQYAVYPNPAYDKVNLKWEDNLNEAEVRLISNTGIIVYYKKLSENGENSHTIDVSHLQAGVYHLQLITDKGISAQKVIKN